MKTCKIKVIAKVPSENCIGCGYINHSSYEYAYHCYDEEYFCRLFKCKIENNQRCVACQSCELEEELEG